MRETKFTEVCTFFHEVRYNLASLRTVIDQLLLIGQYILSHLCYFAFFQETNVLIVTYTRCATTVIASVDWVSGAVD